ncbi:hypothetical protein C8R45DRAFT_1014457 [Mycena sanguinolenta]|nr:hypothetical protein C8R45DRAFT_1014457 [Mycena sanguinolenta]
MNLKVIFSVSAFIAVAAAQTNLCCQQVGSSSDPAIAQFLGLLGVVVPSGTQVGINCSPLGNGCGGWAVACQSTAGGGLIGINCA